MKESETLNDVRTFDFNNFEWKNVHVGGDWIELRRNHTAVIVGKYMLVHAGIN